MLLGYGVKPADVRVAGVESNRKGYRRADLHDAWLRYVPDPAAQNFDDDLPGDSHEIFPPTC